MSKSISTVTPIYSARIEVDGDGIRISDLHFTNPGLAKTLSQLTAEEQSSHVINLLTLGHTVFELSKNSKDMIQFQSLINSLNTDTKRTHDDGLNNLRNLLAKHADGVSEDGLVTKVETAAENALWDALSLENERNPLKPLMLLLTSVHAGLAEKFGAKNAEDNSPYKGGTFNENMNALHQEIATSLGDSTEYVNDVFAPNGQKEGDQIYDISSDITSGQTLRIVSEFKTEKGITIQAIKKELDASMKTRDAQAGIFFVNREGKNRSWHPFQVLTGNRFVVVVDKDDIDPYLVRYAIMHARLALLKTLANAEDDGVDVKKLLYLFDKLEVSLKAMSNIKSAHTDIETGLRDARLWVDNVEKQAKGIFKEIQEVFAKK
jgi:hypothetical protein